MDLGRYLVELRGTGDERALPASVEAARRRATGLATANDPVRVLRSVYVPEDGTWFLLVEAPSVEHVERLLHPEPGVVGSITPALTGLPVADDEAAADRGKGW